MAATRSEIVEYRADGLAMRGDLYRDADGAGARPAVLVFPEAFGLSAHARQRAERLAEERGYVALACDLHGDASVHDDLAAVMPLLHPLQTDTARARARIVPAFEALAARPDVDPTRIAAIGFCFGGTLAFELALSGADLRAAIGFHSGLSVTAPQDAANVRGKVLAMIGAKDPSVTPANRAVFEAMLDAGGVDWQLHLYGGVFHSFTDPAADERNMPGFLHYDAGTDARSWGSMLALLDEVFA